MLSCVVYQNDSDIYMMILCLEQSKFYIFYYFIYKYIIKNILLYYYYIVYNKYNFCCKGQKKLWLVVIC